MRPSPPSPTATKATTSTSRICTVLWLRDHRLGLPLRRSSRTITTIIVISYAASPNPNRVVPGSMATMRSFSQGGGRSLFRLVLASRGAAARPLDGRPGGAGLSPQEPWPRPTARRPAVRPGSGSLRSDEAVCQCPAGDRERFPGPDPARAHRPWGCLTLQWRGWDSGRSPGARGVENGPSGCGKEPRSLI